MTNDLIRGRGMVRTDMYCHNCGKNFIARLDFGLDGNHKIECLCGHIHYRVIKAGVVTGERYDQDLRTHVVERRSVWRCDSQPIITSTASAFIRDRFLNPGED
jgi:hypothetical protein